MTWKRHLSRVLAGIVVVTHFALSIVDLFGLVKIADFMVRDDGSQMDPNDMLPREELFVAMLAMPFLIVVMGFLLLNDRAEAAMLSFVIHGLYGGYQIWKKPLWDATIHPESKLIKTELFIISHLIWVGVSGTIWGLERTAPSANGDKVKVW